MVEKEARQKHSIDRQLVSLVAKWWDRLVVSVGSGVRRGERQEKNGGKMNPAVDLHCSVCCGESAAPHVLRKEEGVSEKE